MEQESYRSDSRAKRVMIPFAFLLPAAVLIVVCLIGGVSPFGNATLITWHNSEFIENLERFRRSITEGESLFFSFAEGLGEGTWSRYAGSFFSPLYLIALLFPSSGMAEAFLLITIVRMGLAGLSAYLLTSSLNDRAELCLGFSVAYGGCVCFLISVFSPLSASAAVLLPAVGAAVISLLREGRVVYLAITLSAFFLFAWQLWPAALFFTAAMFVWGTNAVEEKSALKTAAFRCAAVFVLAFGAGAVFAIPSMIENAEGASAVRSMSDAVGVSFPELLSGLFMGNEAKAGGNAMLYCSACTLVMLPVYFFNSRLPKGERVMAAGILLLLLLVQIIAPLSVIFTGFTAAAECESGVSFVFCTCAVAFAARGLSVPAGITVGKAVGSWAAVGGLYGLSLLLGGNNAGFLIMIVSAGFITLYAAIVLVVMSDRRPPAIFGVVIMLCIFAEAITAGADCMISAKEDSLPVKNESIAEAAAVEDTVDSLLVGWEKTGGRSGVSRVRGRCDVLDSSDLISRSSVEGEEDVKLLSALGIRGENGWTGVTDALFGVRYLISDENDKTYTALSVGEGIGLYENKNALSVGYAASDITLGVDPSMSSNPFTAQELMLSAVLGEQRTVFSAAQINEMSYDGAACNDFGGSKLITRYEEDAELSYTVTALCEGELYMWISSTLPGDAKLLINGIEQEGSDLDAIVSLGRYNALESVTVEMELAEVNTTINVVYFTTLDSEALASALSIISSRQLTFVKAEGNTVKAVAETSGGEVILTTIPYSKNWRAVVDGRQAETAKCMNGLLAVKTEGGQHTLSLTYTPAGFDICMVISAMSLLLMLCYVIMIERNNRNDMPPEPVSYQPERRVPDVPGMESVEEGNVIPVVTPALEVDLDFDSDENTLDWL